MSCLGIALRFIPGIPPAFTASFYSGLGPMHLTLKVDYLCALSGSSILPHGPRVYVGFLFYH